jgi:hypothetical protein
VGRGRNASVKEKKCEKLKFINVRKTTVFRANKKIKRMRWDM